MKKLILLPCVALALMACTPQSENTTNQWALPENLKDCTIDRLRDGQLQFMNVVRCPNSTTSTTYTQGKTTQTTVVIDGIEYKAVNK